MRGTLLGLAAATLMVGSLVGVTEASGFAASGRPGLRLQVERIERGSDNVMPGEDIEFRITLSVDAESAYRLSTTAGGTAGPDMEVSLRNMPTNDVVYDGPVQGTQLLAAGNIEPSQPVVFLADLRMASDAGNQYSGRTFSAIWSATATATESTLPTS